MHDLGVFRSDLERISERLSQRGFTVPVDEFRDLDVRRRAAITEAEELKAQRNAASAEIGRSKRTGADTSRCATTVSDDEGPHRAAGRARKGAGRRVPGHAGRHSQRAARIRAGGKSAEDNVEVRRVGQPRTVRFRAQGALGPRAWNWAFSIWNAPRRSPARASRCIGAWARSWSARSINFMLDVHTREHGYTEVLPPFLVNSASFTEPGNCRNSTKICSSAKITISG